MKNPDHFRHVVENIVLLGATAAGLAGSSDVKPSSWYFWGASRFDARGCLVVAGIQSHQVAQDERVDLRIQPMTGGSPVAEALTVDFSGKAITIFERIICVPPKNVPNTMIVFTARRDGIPAPPSLFPPKP